MSGFGRARGLLAALRPLDDGATAEVGERIPRLPGVVPIGTVEPLLCWRVAGVIHSMVVEPREDLSIVEARITDGTGSITARWLGWSSLRGLRPRMVLLLEGLVEVGADGRQVLFEPEYEAFPLS